jgi:formylglycine-generating enzyme required for sulfatase activity
VNTPVDPFYPGGYNNSATGGVNCTNPAAIPGAIPIVDIRETEAKTSCASIGAHLLTNDEYMTIVTDAAAQGSNWTGNAVGTGGMYLGNANNAREYPADANDANGYSDGAGSTLLHQKITNTGDERRTYTLSNGSVIWDISGNVWEWVQRSTNNQGDNQSASYATPTCTGTPWNWCEYGSVAVSSINPIMNYGAIPQLSIAPPNASWNTTQGMGRVYTNDGGNGAGAFIRGGSWNDGAGDGPFSLGLSSGPAGVDRQRWGSLCPVVVA